MKILYVHYISSFYQVCQEKLLSRENQSGRKLFSKQCNVLSILSSLQVSSFSQIHQYMYRINIDENKRKYMYYEYIICSLYIYLPYDKSVKRSYLEKISLEEIICYLNYPKLHIQCIVYIAMTCKAVQNSRSDLPVQQKKS